MQEASISLDDGLVLNGVRVLVVEDDGLLLMELEAVLLDAGAEVAGLCRPVDEALRIVKLAGWT
jgi:chemotaxis response regulator CheB